MGPDREAPRGPATVGAGVIRRPALAGVETYGRKNGPAARLSRARYWFHLSAVTLPLSWLLARSLVTS
jgi:hypothetical protein